MSIYPQIRVVRLSLYNVQAYNRIWQSVRAEPDAEMQFGTISSPAMHAWPWDTIGFGDWRKYIIEVDKERVGVGAIVIDKQNRVCNIELALIPCYRGRGLGGIAGRILIRKCFEEFNARLVEASALSTNLRSIGMRDWMTLEATLKGRWLVSGKEVDELVYVITREDFEYHSARLLGDAAG